MIRWMPAQVLVELWRCLCPHCIYKHFLLSSYRIRSPGMPWHPRVLRTCHQCTQCMSSSWKPPLVLRICPRHKWCMARILVFPCTSLHHIPHMTSPLMSLSMCRLHSHYTGLILWMSCTFLQCTQYIDLHLAPRARVAGAARQG